MRSVFRSFSDPEPERDDFTRSDQYSFIRKGIPALSLKVGFIKGSPKRRYVQRWRKERYHAPSDDVNQPVDLKRPPDFSRLYARAVEEVANRESRPRWNDASFFSQVCQPERHVARSAVEPVPKVDRSTAREDR